MLHYLAWSNRCASPATDAWLKLRANAADMIAQCPVDRLARKQGIDEVRRGKEIQTTIPDKTQACPSDLATLKWAS